MNRFRLRGALPRLAPAFLAFAVLFIACAKHDAEFGSQGVVIPKDSLSASDSLPKDTLRFASLNMSIGFPVSQLVFTDMADPVVAYNALTKLYDRYLLTRPKDRIKAMAHAIDSLQPQVIALQEVLYFKRDGALVDDYLRELIEAIKDDGGPAYQVFPVTLNDTVLTGAAENGSIRIDFHEGNALLVHPDLAVLATDSLRYYNVFRLSVENPTKSERAANYVKVRSPKGVVWQIYGTHLEVFEDVSSNQAAELAKFQQEHEDRVGGRTAVAQVILGDFNIEAGKGAHRVLQEAGFSDTFDSSAADPGSTCCVAGSALWAPDTAFSERRIDYIMARHWVKTVGHATALREAFTAGDGTRLLATDHRMLHATLVAQ